LHWILGLIALTKICLNCDKLAMNWHNYECFHTIKHVNNINHVEIRLIGFCVVFGNELS
jgi:hypothetical protein